jgi:hypothetical protein
MPQKRMQQPYTAELQREVAQLTAQQVDRGADGGGCGVFEADCGRWRGFGRHGLVVPATSDDGTYSSVNESIVSTTDINPVKCLFCGSEAP